MNTKFFSTIIMAMVFMCSASASSHVLDLNEIIGDTKGVNYVAINSVEQSGGKESPERYNLTENDKNVFVVDYGDKGIIKGEGICTAKSGTGAWNGAKQLHDITNTLAFSNKELQSSILDSQYCWCRLKSYKSVIKELENLSSKWMFAIDYRDGEAIGCDALCTDFCARMLQNENSDKNAKIFRSAMFSPLNDQSNKSITKLALNEIIGDAKGIKYEIKNEDKFIVDYGDNGKIYGHGLCSSVSGTDTGSDWDTLNIVNNLADEAGKSIWAYNCWCQLDGYTQKDGTHQKLSMPWIYGFDFGGDCEEKECSEICEKDCAQMCADELQTNNKTYLPFRLAVFNLASNQYPTCENGYRVSPFTTPLINTIGDAKGIKYELNNKEEFIVDYGNNGKIRGYGRCSNKSGISATDTNNYLDVTITSSPALTSEDGQNQYCWCTIDGYAPHGEEISTFSNVTDVWVFLNNYVDIDTCTENCTTGCANTLQNDNNLVFRSAIFNSQVIHLERCETK